MKNLIFTLLAVPMLAFAALQDSDRQEMIAKSLLKNGGFEMGKGAAGHKWTASGGTFNIVSSGTNLLTGKASATWDSNASSQTLLYSQISYPHKYDSGNGVAFCKIQTPSGTATHLLQVLDGSSNILGSITINSQTTPIYTFINFGFPASGGTVALQLKSVASDEPLIAIDDCFVGDASEVNLSQIAQSAFIGTAKIAATASCNWTRTNTALGSFSTTSACPGPTVLLNPGPGTIQTTDTDLPKFTVNNLPSGVYRVVIWGAATQSDGSGDLISYAINDGTTTAGEGGAINGASAGSPLYIEGVFSYTSAGNKTFEVYGAATAGVIHLENTGAASSGAGGGSLNFSIFRYPSSTELAYKPDASGSLYWSGYHSNDCAWAVTNVAYTDFAIDSSCTFTERVNRNFGTVTSYNDGTPGNNRPGIVFTSKRAGAYFVCATLVRHSGSTSYGYQLDESVTGSVIARGFDAESTGQWGNLTLCGIWNAPNAATQYTIRIKGKSASGAINIDSDTAAADETVNWAITSLDQQFPAPLLVNSVISPSSGVEKVVRARLVCSASSSITSQSGSWVTSIGNVASGKCSVVIPSSTFSSTAFSCTATPVGTAVTSINGVQVNNMTSTGFDLYFSLISTGSSTIAAATSVTADVICMGPN